MSLDFTQTNEQILNHLNEVVKVPTGKLFQFGVLEDHFPGTGRMRMVAETVRQMAQIDVEADLLYRKASNGGANLTSDLAQKTIRAVAHAKNWPQDLTDFILSYCLWTGPRWQHLGFQEPSLDWIQAQREQFEFQNNKDRLREDYDKIREIWIGTYQQMLKWINAKQEAGDPAPELDDIILELRD